MMPPADAWEGATLCPVCGRESCEDHLPPEPDARPRTSALHVQRALDCLSAPQPVEILEGAAWAGCLTVLVSESGAGKTFVLLDAAACVSAGIAWHGRQTRQGSVAYLSYEGDALGLRLRALRDQSGHRLEHLYIIRARDPLSPRVTRDGEECSIGEVDVTRALEALTEALTRENRPPLDAVIVDTVRASMTGSEDSSEHVAAYLRAVRRLAARVPDAAWILAHHAGWQDGDTQRKRERGSSAWRGNCDATLYLEAGEYDPQRGEAPLTIRALKVRDAERPTPLHLIRRRVELAESNGRGEPVTSCVIERDRRTREDREAEQAHAADTAHRATDLAVLRAIRDYPDATNSRRLRTYLNLRYDAVQDAVSRILRAQWATEGKRGQPYVLTEAGRCQINQ
jgi:AAA domain